MQGILNINPEKRFDINQALKTVKEMVKSRYYDPFKKNKDSQEVLNIFMQFGKNQLASDLRYLQGL